MAANVQLNQYIMARSFKVVGNFTDKSELVNKLAEMKTQGFQRIGSTGSKLPDGIHNAKIVSYRLLEGKDTDVNAKYSLVLYSIEVPYKGTTIEDTVLSNEEGDAILNIGTTRKVEKFELNGKKLNRWVLDEVSEDTTAEPNTMRTAAQGGN